MKDKADPLPEFKSSTCPSSPAGDHESLMNESYCDYPTPVTVVGNSFLGVWDGGSLEIRVCKHCQLLYSLLVKY